MVGVEIAQPIKALASGKVTFVELGAGEQLHAATIAIAGKITIDTLARGASVSNHLKVLAAPARRLRKVMVLIPPHN